jgi:DNA-binding PadR family transcriptional regulator
MAKRQVDLLQGTLDLLVLKSLALGPLHGLGVSNRIAQITKGTFKVKPGSLFPALHRMEEAGWLSTIALPQRAGVSSTPKRRTGSAFPWRSPPP